jgi:hypothetical protein
VCHFSRITLPALHIAQKSYCGDLGILREATGGCHRFGVERETKEAG